MQADPYWACTGAVNVMLVFFFRFNAEQLRRLNVYYWIICYGIPSIPAIFGLIYRKDGEHMYGDATVKSHLIHQNQNSPGLHISTPPDLTFLPTPILHMVLTFPKSKPFTRENLANIRHPSSGVGTQTPTS
jgi:hypothetical protein